MLGRGTRVISETDFQSVTTTPNAHKTRFVIVDAVGVTEQELIDTGTVERKRSVPLKSLLEAVAVGAVDDDLLASLARRLGLLEKRLSAAQQAGGRRACWTCPPRRSASPACAQLSNALLDAIDPDAIYAGGQAHADAQVASMPAPADPTEAELEAARQQLVDARRDPAGCQPGSCAASCWSGKS